MTPRTRYAKSGDVNVASQVVGEGPFDGPVDPRLVREEPVAARFLEQLASILFDKRGTGLSDRLAPPRPDLPTLVLHRSRDRDASVEEGRWIASRPATGSSRRSRGPAEPCARPPRSAPHSVSSGSKSAPGVHTGECERAGTGVRGIAVHVAARVAAHARGGEILATSTVHDLVAGSGIMFADRGSSALEDVGLWRLYGVLDG